MGNTRFAPTLDITPAEVAQIAADAEMMRFLVIGGENYERFLSSFREFRRSVTELREDTKAAQFPPLPTMLPPAGFKTGLFHRLDKIVRRIRAHPRFNDEMEALLGLRKSYPAREMELLESPRLSVTALPGSMVRIKFFRGAASGIDVEAKIDKAPDWQPVGRFLASPVDIKIPQNENGLPRFVQIRAVYIEKNSPVGGYSDIASAVTLP